MPDDILDAAQKAINDAAKTGGVPPAPTPPPVSTTEKPSETQAPTTIPALPVEPPPVSPNTTADASVASASVAPPPIAASSPVVPTTTVSTPTEPTVTVAPPTFVVPPPGAEPLDATKQQMVSELLGGAPVSTATNPTLTVPTAHASGGSIPPKKKSTKGLLLALIATLLLTLPFGVYFISQKDSNLTDQRNRAAWDTEYEGCDKDDPLACNGNPRACHCQNGNVCTFSLCDYSIEQQCRTQGRQYCVNGFNTNAFTCCYPGYSCGPGNVGCYREGHPPNPTDTPPGRPTPTTPITRNTPTPTSIAPICVNIKIYKGGAQVSPSTLLPGDNVVLAVKGNLTPTKAHFRINGGDWQETTTKNASDEFTLNYTVPSGVPSFVIEAEVFTNGAWW